MASRIDNITNLPPVETDSGVRVRLNESQVQSLVTQYLQDLTKPRKAPAGGQATQHGADLDEFFELVQNVIVSKQNQEGVKSNKRILVVEDDPPEAVDTEALTFYLKASVPGRFDQGPSGAGRIREVTPHIRAVVDHPEAPSQKLITAGRFYDNWITFNIYARTHKVARERLVWFERMMDISR